MTEQPKSGSVYRTIRTIDGDMLDVICLNHYGHAHRYVEAVLNSNPGLADQGAVLSAGTIILLPDLTELGHQEAAVRLWD